MTDRFPQILTAVTETPAGADDYAVATINLPRGDSPASRGRRNVYELLSADYYPGILDLGDFVGNIYFMCLSTTSIRSTSDTCTVTTVRDDIADPLVFGAVLQERNLSTNGGFVQDLPLHYDFTDEAGNGILVATDRMFVTQGNIAGTTASNGIVKIKYRNVAVPAIEFVGIVQSQISAT